MKMKDEEEEQTRLWWHVDGQFSLFGLSPFFLVDLTIFLYVFVVLAMMTMVVAAAAVISKPANQTLFFDAV